MDQAYSTCRSIKEELQKKKVFCKLLGKRPFEHEPRVEQACSAFYTVRATATDFSLYAGSMKFNT